MYLYTENPLKFAFSEANFDAAHQIQDSGYGILGVPFAAPLLTNQDHVTDLFLSGKLLTTSKTIIYFLTKT